MLKLSAIIQTMAFVFTETNATEHQLKITAFTVQDVKRLMELQDVLHEDNDLTTLQQSEIIVLSRIVCAVKYGETGEYYWKNVDDFLSRDYPNELVDALYKEVQKLNPMGDIETLNEKKSKS